MKVLVFGPSGSGKTFVATALAQLGVPAFDADTIEGLSNWYNKQGKKIDAPTTADEALKNGYAFLWSKKAMQRFIDQQQGDVYMFGGSGNVADVFVLFDRVYFLHVNSTLQLQRLRSHNRATPLMDQNEGKPVIWGDWFEQMAKEHNIPFIDASQTPEYIYSVISSNH